MTAKLTKQNARDKALRGGNSTPTTNSEFETLRVKGDPTIDGKIENEQITNIETRIMTLKETLADVLPFEDGLNDKELIFKIADVDYQEGTNIFEFLASTGYYTMSPRPESCTTYLLVDFGDFLRHLWSRRKSPKSLVS